MRKNIILFSILSVLLFISCGPSNKGEYDTRAVESLDILSETIGELTSLSYTVNSYRIDKEGKELNKHSDVYLKGINKIFIENESDNGDKSFWYNGDKFAYFLYDRNEYDILDAPDNTLKLIDSIHSKYGIYFPAADFLYPTLTDDILDNYEQLLYFGEEKIDDNDCISIESSNDKTLVQIWIDKETNLPHKMVIESKTNKNKYYEATYSNWKINPNLPDVLFEFQPPSGSTQVKFQSKK